MGAFGTLRRSSRWDSPFFAVVSASSARPSNHPTLFGGVVVHPGDLILGDDDGMVVVARKDCEAVLEKSNKRTQNEEKKAEQLKAGISSVEINKLADVFKSLGLIEE
jgi:4-hydroxy-4-methyl-2-oxoglutarate aldolase